MPNTYHVGLLARGDTAVFQFRRSKDTLSPQILEYYGERETTIREARERLRANPAAVIAQLAKDYPRRGFARAVIA